MPDGFDLGLGDISLPGLTDIDFSSLSNQFSGLDLSPGPALSTGPYGQTGASPWSGLFSGFGDIARGVLPVAQLGGGLMGIASGIQGARQLGEQTNLARQAGQRQGQLAQAAQGTAAPLSAFSASQLQAAQQGQIPHAVQAQIEQWAQGAKQRVMDLAARTGQGSSSQVQSWLSWIDQQAQAMAAQALQDEIQSGIAAGGTAGGVLGAGAAAAGGAGQTAASQQQGLESLIAAANQALARLG